MEFEAYQQPLEQSYERDSRWKPHLSWSYLSWKLQQRMEEQQLQRELAWQRIADKLGPLIISSDGGLTFGQAVDYDAEGANERAQERSPFYTQKLSYATNLNKNNNNSHYIQINNNNNNNNPNSNNTKQQLSSHTNSSHATTNKLSTTTTTTNSNYSSTIHGSIHKHHDKARRRCMTVSGILIALILLLFTLVVLMGLGILHR